MGHPVFSLFLWQQWKGIEAVEEFYRLDAYGYDLADEADDVFGVVFAVGIVDNAGAGIGGDAILVHDPFEDGVIIEAVFVDLGRNAAQGEKAVVKRFGIVFGKGHLLDAPVELAVFDSVNCAISKALLGQNVPLRNSYLIDSSFIRKNLLD